MTRHYSQQPSPTVSALERYFNSVYKNSKKTRFVRALYSTPKKLFMPKRFYMNAMNLLALNIPETNKPTYN